MLKNLKGKDHTHDFFGSDEDEDDSSTDGDTDEDLGLNSENSGNEETGERVLPCSDSADKPVDTGNDKSKELNIQMEKVDISR